MSVDDDPQTRLVEPEPPEGYDFDPAEYADSLRAYGIEPDHLGAQPAQISSDLDEDDDWWRFQVMQEYWFDVSAPTQNETPIAPIQFRVQVHTVNEPPLSLQRHLRSLQLHRLPTMFNTGTSDPGHWESVSDTYEGYLEGFFPGEGWKSAVNTENQAVGQRDAQNIGIVEWYVEIYTKDHELRGYANGFLDPFTTRGEEAPLPPQQEKWYISYLPSRLSNGTYELRPQPGNTRRRLEGQRKVVLVNGQYIGRTQPGTGAATHGGTVQVAKEYAGRPQLDPETGQRPVDREFLKQQGMHPNEFRDGDPIYKIQETADTISLVTAKRRIPYEWDPVDPDAVDPDATGAVDRFLDLLTDDEPTLFDVREDENNPDHGYAALGKYRPPVRREISTATEFDFPPPPI